MYQRGGGVRDIQFRELKSDMGVCDIFVDVREAMGANIVNTLCE